jgi:uncharacterized protein involved in exopolysaccharide biosynthesis
LSNTNYISWIGRNIRPILIVQVIAIIFGSVISMPYFMPPQYKSNAIVYPYNFSAYSRETPTEQMLQFLTSLDIRNEVIKKFDLIKHYEIDTTKEEWRTKLYGKYDKNIVIGATEYEAVYVTVYDNDSKMACDIVNGVLQILNEKVLAVQKEKSSETAKMLKRQLDDKKKQCDSLTTLSKYLSTQFGLLDYANQTREVARAYYQNSNSAKGADIVNQMRNMEEKGMELQAVNQHLTASLTDYDGLMMKYQEAMKDVNKEITFSNVVEAPTPADKKSYPIRWIIVLISCAVGLVFTVVVLRLIEKFIV